MKFILCSVALLLAAQAGAQEDTIPKKRLHTPAIAGGTIGGESHDSYVIHAEKGRTISLDIAWPLEDDNQAQFTVSESANFFNNSPVTFGSESEHGRHWTGTLPATGDYYIYVVAHPSAHYTLRVTLK